MYVSCVWVGKVKWVGWVKFVLVKKKKLSVCDFGVYDVFEAYMDLYWPITFFEESPCKKMFQLNIPFAH